MKGKNVEQLAKALRDEMKRRGHSYREAAAVMGVSWSSVNNWSKGWIDEAPRQKNLEAMAEYLGHPVYIVYGMVGMLTQEQVEALQAIPGYLSDVEASALSMVQERLFLISA